MDAVVTGASSLPASRPPTAARPLYSRFPALTPVAPYISRQWTARLRQTVTAERSEAATSASYRPSGIPADRQSGSLSATCAVSGANYAENGRQPTRHGAMRAVTEQHDSSEAVAAQDPCRSVTLRFSACPCGLAGHATAGMAGKRARPGREPYKSGPPGYGVAILKWGAWAPPKKRWKSC